MEAILYAKEVAAALGYKPGDKGYSETIQSNIEKYEQKEREEKEREREERQKEREIEERQKESEGERESERESINKIELINL